MVANHPLEGADPSRVIVCPDSKQAMIQMGENYRRQFHPKVVGITGSVGKTTTKEFCGGSAFPWGQIIKTQGNQNNEIGVPNTLFQLEQDTQFAVVEMGMSALGEISQLSRAAKPDVGIITCIGVSHMESLGSKENIRKAKLEICEGLPSGAPLILNGDDPMLRQAQYEGLLPTHVRPIWYSTEDDGADVWASEIVFTQKGQRFWLNDRKHGRFWVEIRHWEYTPSGMHCGLYGRCGFGAFPGGVRQSIGGLPACPPCVKVCARWRMCSLWRIVTTQARTA